MDLKELKPVVGSQYWPIFEDFLEEQEEMLVNSLVNGKQLEELHELRGKIKAIRQMRALRTAILS